MWRALLHDSAALRAYLLTKVAVLALAALVSWPLAHLVGPRAWLGLAVFAGVLALITAVILTARLVTRSPATVAVDGESEPDLGPGDTVALPVEDSLDLHSFPPRSIPEVVADYLEEAHRLGLGEVRLIHGRGIGVQRERVRSLLARSSLVEAFHDAPPAAGGCGATVVYLKRVGRVG